MKANEPHLSVLLEEAVAALAIKPDGIYIDGTYGRGGHSAMITKALGENGRLIAIDRDEEAIANALSTFKNDSRVEIAHQSFSELENLVKSKDLLGKIDGILLDLGVSSPQLDNAERGFSFQKDGPLDMRMDNSRGQSAQQWVAQTSEEEIAEVLWKYGEEKLSRRIARAIVTAREKEAIQTTAQLAQIISSAIPKKEKHKNPATRSFQAIRIKINDELTEVEKVLLQSIDILAPKGRLVVISFHSLEDRIVKRFIRDYSRGKQLPREIPVSTVEKGPLIKIGKAIKAGPTELNFNPRARSAVLRIAEKRAVEHKQIEGA